MLNQFQLRRIGLPSSVDGIGNVFKIKHDTTLIGRGNSVDIFLDSTIRKGLISRAHAQIIQKKINNEFVFELYDTSLNGTYVNDFRVKGIHLLKDGDVVAFGHLRGSLIDAGANAPQKESEFLFKFESCINAQSEMTNFEEKLHQSNSMPSVFMSPESPSKVVQPGVVTSSRDINKSSPANRKRKFSEDNELLSLVSSVTSKLKNTNEELEDSFTINFDGDLPESQLSTKPCHPKMKMTNSKTFARVSSPASHTSSDSEIRGDVSLNAKHIINSKKKKRNENRTIVKKHVRKVLDSHDVGEKLETQIYNTDSEADADPIQSESALNSKGNDLMQYDSEYSEEVTDSPHSSDGDFEPLASKSKVKKRNIKEKKQTAAKKSTDRLHTSTQNNSEVKTQFTHDKCAALECKRPSGAIKKITWVQCDGCDQWYHLQCSGLNAKQARKKNTHFRCGC